MRTVLLLLAVAALFLGRPYHAKDAETQAMQATAQVVELRKQVADLQEEIADLEDEMYGPDDGSDSDGVLEGPAVKRRL